MAIEEAALWPSPDAWPKATQGGHIDTPPPELRDVKNWIATILSVPAVRLVNVFALKSWSVAALFQVDGSSKQAVFKANRLEIFFQNAEIYKLLQQCCPDRVPELIGHHTGDSGAWTLFRPIRGQGVEELGRADLLLKMAETLAQIQIAFAALPESSMARLPQFGTDRIPHMLETLIEGVREDYLPRWQTAGGALLIRPREKRMIEIPEDFMDRLEAGLEKVVDWVKELQAGGWPQTVYHSDFHPGNAMVETNGNLRIIDWDQGGVGFPFDSIYWLDSIADEEEWRVQLEGGRSVKDAYLDTIPWNSRDDRLRAWELGARLTRIISAYEAEQRNDAFQRQDRLGGNIASLLINALKEWESAE